MADSEAGESARVRWTPGEKQTMKKTNQRLIHVLIFAGLRTQKSLVRRSNKKNEPYLPGTWLGWLRFRKRTVKLHLRMTRQFFLSNLTF